jgi:hypothetical protein
MAKISARRIDHLKTVAYACGFTNEQAREYGKLSATTTWEKLLITHGLEFQSKTEINNNTVATANQESPRQLNLLEWIDFGQLFALSLALVGCVLLALSLWSRLNLLNLLPQVKITIQVGTK